MQVFFLYERAKENIRRMAPTTIPCSFVKGSIRLTALVVKSVGFRKKSSKGNFSKGRFKKSRTAPLRQPGFHFHRLLGLAASAPPFLNDRRLPNRIHFYWRSILFSRIFLNWKVFFRPCPSSKENKGISRREAEKRREDMENKNERQRRGRYKDQP